LNIPQNEIRNDSAYSAKLLWTSFKDCLDLRQFCIKSYDNALFQPALPLSTRLTRFSVSSSSSACSAAVSGIYFCTMSTYKIFQKLSTIYSDIMSADMKIFQSLQNEWVNVQSCMATSIAMHGSQVSY